MNILKFSTSFFVTLFFIFLLCIFLLINYSRNSPFYPLHDYPPRVRSLGSDLPDGRRARLRPLILRDYLPVFHHPDADRRPEVVADARDVSRDAFERRDA